MCECTIIAVEVTMNITAFGAISYCLVNFINNSEEPTVHVFLPDYKLRRMQEGCNPRMHTV